MMAVLCGPQPPGYTQQLALLHRLAFTTSSTDCWHLLDTCMALVQGVDGLATVVMSILVGVYILKADATLQWR